MASRVQRPFAVSRPAFGNASYAGDASYNAATTTTPITFTVVKDTPAIGCGRVEYDGGRRYHYRPTNRFHM